MTEIRTLSLGQIILDEDAQPRVTMNFGMVEEFADDMLRGDDFPPLDVFHDGENYWLADGFHRYHAALALKLESIPCRVHEGDLDDAVWFSLQANRENGVRRTQQDVRNAVKRAIVHRNGIDETDRFIAHYIGTSFATVSRERQSLVVTATVLQSPFRVDKNGVERVLPQPRTRPQAEPEAEKREADPNQIDLEDYPGVKQPQPINYIDRSNDWIHNELKAAVAAMRKLPDPQETVANYPVGVGYTLPVEDAEAILDWWAGFVPLWAERFPEFQARLDKMIRSGQEKARGRVLGGRG
jgi:hypothetical protein